MVVTYDGLSKIKRSLPAILGQTRKPDSILVVDNDSGDGTEEFLEALRQREPSIEILKTPENLGPAGGFNVGMAWAYEKGFGYIWLLDDDSVPDSNCLGALVEGLGPASDTIAWPRNLDESGRETAYPAWRGQLLPRQVIECGGLPNRDFFWGVEDTEYFQWRLPKLHGIRSVRVGSTIVRYTASNPRKRSSWHYYYRPRNNVYYRVWIQGLRIRRLWRLALVLTKLTSKIIFVEDQKLTKLRFLTRGIWDGLSRRIGKTLDPGSLAR